ncbi:MAG: FkbM family methyltransferase [Xanthobacteraceae bacterium]
MTTTFGEFAPSGLDRAVIAATSRMPNNWLGLRMAILLRRIVTSRLNGRGIDVTRWGMNLRLHPGDNGCEKNLLFTPQMYEPVELAELAAEIRRAYTQRRPFVFVDIGANVGLFSLFVASHRECALTIIAVEPEPGNVGRLLFNVGANAPLPICVKPIALGRSAGRARVRLDRRDRGGTTTETLASEGADSANSVSCMPLTDVLLEERLEGIDALKIDTEGAEDAILVPFFRDAPASLWPRMIIIEDSGPRWSVDLLALLLKRGYIVSARSKQNLVLRRTAA